MKETQNYSNHVRWFPLVHFVITPILLILIIWSVVDIVRNFNAQSLQFFILTVTVLLVSFAARLQALKAQDRVIRLEERLRYKELLAPELARKASEFRARQVIALRFASDKELPELAEHIAAGNLTEPSEIKSAIKDWRADHFRV
ncbi:MAG TPA: DUF6526 family protein [Pyrinomonadaceae bacterium]|nr:DUF6526 family protein [Pyrinomonadaceae bacterium]HMP64956.1 DUF6526 family protein [Pyrinomonadaceae bacterium]